MTREEATRIIKECKEKGFKYTFYTVEEYHTALEIAIKALEQESVLDKIRAEIERQEKWLLQAGYNSYNVDIAFSSIKSVLTESEVHEC